MCYNKRMLNKKEKKLRKVVIAFDVDGTLRCNCSPVCQDLNKTADLVPLFKSMKNTKLIVWSGQGQKYAEMWARRVGLTQGYAKYDPPSFPVDIAIDDQHEFDQGKINLIVREK